MKTMPHEKIIHYLKDNHDLHDINPSSYYINIDDFLNSMDELYETGKEFGKHGVITLPCKHTIFVFKKPKDIWVANYCYHDPEENTFRVLGFTQPSMFLKDHDEDFHANPLLAIYHYKDEKVSVGYDYKITDDSIEEASEEELKDAFESALTWMRYILSAIMFLNTKYTEVREAKSYMLSEKTKKPSAKKKHKYSVIKLTKTVYKQLEESDALHTVRPHFRRGHMRTLQNGKIIPVRECLVNVKDNAEFEKLPFKVVK